MGKLLEGHAKAWVAEHFKKDDSLGEGFELLFDLISGSSSDEGCSGNNWRRVRFRTGQTPNGRFEVGFESEEERFPDSRELPGAASLGDCERILLDRGAIEHRYISCLEFHI